MLTLQNSGNSLSGSAGEITVYSGNKNLHWTLFHLENMNMDKDLGFLLPFLALQEKLLCWARIKGHGRKSVGIWSSELLAVLLCLVSVPKGAGVCDRAKQALQTLLAPPSAIFPSFMCEGCQKPGEMCIQPQNTAQCSSQGWYSCSNSCILFTASSASCPLPNESQAEAKPRWLLYSQSGSLDSAQLLCKCCPMWGFKQGHHTFLWAVNLLLLNQKLQGVCSFWMKVGEFSAGWAGADPTQRQWNCSCSTSLACSRGWGMHICVHRLCCHF